MASNRNSSVEFMPQRESQRNSDSDYRQRLRKEYEFRKQLEKKYNKDNEEDRKKIEETLSKYRKVLDKEEVEAQEKRYKEMYKDLHKNISQIGDNITSSLKSTVNSISSSIDSYMTVYSNYMSGVNARVQGADTNYKEMVQLLRTQVGSSQFVSQKKLLENLNTLVGQGIVYNVEQRAFLQTLSEDIATTFDAANGTLVRLIRIQQSDTTAARLGMEASLTKLLNQMFEDTSYLNSDFDSTSTALLEATSQLSGQQGVELEYVAQKWLGALGSMGVSSSTLSSIASGLGYLGSGNVSALSGNASLQNLLAIASQGSYGQLLSGGLSSTAANQLMSNIVATLQNAYASSSSNVVRSQYAELFGVTISDMAAIAKLTTEDLKTIYETGMTYNDALVELSDQISELPSRMHIAERINNLVDNMMMTSAEAIAGSTAGYVTWTLAGIAENVLSGTAYQLIPTAAKGALFGMGLLDQVGGIVSELLGRNTLGYDASNEESISNWFKGWEAAQVTSRGEGFSGGNSQVSMVTGQTITFGTSDGADTLTAKTVDTQTVTGAEVVSNINDDVAAILEILQYFKDEYLVGNPIKVTVDNYGLTGL